ncbi:hypothetical protein KZ483_07005 [Paenibacillus sp. sptzw28]|uniref:hypothetical protein n=1 Tax=Paenibacillus sp. sptzw28 TaxID=715179 RepID=UPI001C6F1622|nr:hypothetical protein [Paenibacillus sp. sptzw28]QYR22689.1 hypothetical protein KZ483_07005 [Paenibacillus sp. sptzw28]
MARLLDARTSQNASFSSSISDTFGMDPELFAQVGLDCINPVGIIRVQFTATATINISAASDAVVEIFVVRGTRSTDPQVYNAIFSEGDNPGPLMRVFTVTGSDYNVPPPPSNLLVYTAFIRGIANLGSTLTRVGPESFNAVAYCDD